MLSKSPAPEELNGDRVVLAQRPNFANLVILGLIFIIYLILYWKYFSNANQLVVQIIIYGGLFLKLYQKQGKINLSSSWMTRLTGLGILFLLLLRTSFLSPTDASIFLFYFFPIVSFIGYIILIGGFQGIKQFRTEFFTLIAICILIPLSNLFVTSLDPNSHRFLTNASAELTASFLWYLGFEPTTQGSLVFVNGGAVDILLGCTGWSLFVLLTQLSVCMLLLFGRWIKNPIFPFILSFGISLILSIIRLMIMAVVVTDKPTFTYWHGHEGESIFTSIGMIIFWGIIFLRLPSSFSLELPPINYRVREACLWHRTVFFPWIVTFILSIFLFNFALGLNSSPGMNQFTSYKFPGQIPLSQWNFVESYSSPLPDKKQPETRPGQEPELTNPNDPNNFIVAANQTYRYKNDENQTLTVKNTYIVNTLGIMEQYYPKSPVLRNAIEKQGNDGPYLSSIHQNQSTLTACINVKGKTTTNYRQFTHYIRQSYLEISHLFNSLIGKELLQDRRCLLLEVSIDDANIKENSQLTSVWSQLVSYWQKNFPSLRS